MADCFDAGERGGAHWVCRAGAGARRAAAALLLLLLLAALAAALSWTSGGKGGGEGGGKGGQLSRWELGTSFASWWRTRTQTLPLTLTTVILSLPQP